MFRTVLARIETRDLSRCFRQSSLCMVQYSRKDLRQKRLFVKVTVADRVQGFGMHQLGVMTGLVWSDF